MYNNRDDQYGGSPENRARVLGEILDDIRQSVSKDYCVIAKINCDDFFDGGLNVHECIVACKIMQEHGIDAIEISGNYTSREARAGAGEGYFLKYAVTVKNRVDVPIILVGGHPKCIGCNMCYRTPNHKCIFVLRGKK